MTQVLIQLGYIILFVMVGMIVLSLHGSLQHNKTSKQCIKLEESISYIRNNYSLYLEASKKTSELLMMIPIDTILEHVSVSIKDEVLANLKAIHTLLEKIELSAQEKEDGV